jgi:hypothetical protein
MGDFRKRLRKDPEMVPERPVAVKIKGGFRLPGDLLDSRLLTKKGPVLILKIIHRLFLFSPLLQVPSARLMNPLRRV